MLREILIKLFIRPPECWHNQIVPTSSGNFCPDCGKEVFISWLILRCECCCTKREAQPAMGTIFPVNKYCIKCGSRKYFIEKLHKLEIYDLHYAVLVKEEFENKINLNRRTQVWVENENIWAKYICPKLIPLLSR